MELPTLEELEGLLEEENGTALALERLGPEGLLRWKNWTVRLCFDPEGPSLAELLEDGFGGR